MGQYTVNVNGNDYVVTVKSVDGNMALVDVDGWEFEVNIHDAAGGNPGSSTISTSQESKKEKKKRTSSIDAGAADAPATAGPTGPGVVAAHLPGLIREILVEPGDSVNKGDVICKMEAMKMENDVLAHMDGTVQEILVKVQENVMENQAIMVLE